MKFGKVEQPELVDFTLPVDHPGTKVALNKYGGNQPVKFNVGCAKWNKTDLKNFYPRGTKNELEYYSGEFNSIELNATFYRFFPAEQFQKWKETVGPDFRFFPKITQNISQFKRLNDVEALVDQYLDGARALEDKLGGVFLQMIQNFAPKDFDRVVRFIEYWPTDEVPLSVEFRHTDWYNDATVANELYHLYESNNVCNIITDTAGRRDLLHMRLTNAKTFIRYVGANHSSDYDRLDVWVSRIQDWIEQGIEEVNFFVHQNLEKESPLLSTHFVRALNDRLGQNLHVPANLIDNRNEKDLFNS